MFLSDKTEQFKLQDNQIIVLYNMFGWLRKQRKLFHGARVKHEWGGV